MIYSSTVVNLVGRASQVLAQTRSSAREMESLKIYIFIYSITFYYTFLHSFTFYRMPCPHLSDVRLASSTLATEATVRSTSSSEVCQLLTLTRIARLPCQVVPLKSDCPSRTTAAITRSVHWAWS